MRTLNVAEKVQDDTLQFPYNSRIIDIYIKLINDRYPDLNVTEILDFAGMKPYQIADQGHWFSQDQVDRFYTKLVQLTGNSTIAREAGRYAAITETGNIFRRYILGLLGPANAYMVLEKASPYLTRSTDFKSRKLSSNCIEVIVTPRPGIEEKKYQCENRIGILEAISMIFHHKLPAVEHPECIFDGGDKCRYVLSWEKNSRSRIKLFRAGFSLFLILCTGISFILNPAAAFRWVLPSVLILGAGSIAATFKHEVTKLKQSLKDFQHSTEELILQTKINYNNTLLAHEIGQATNKYMDINIILQKVITIAEKRLDYDRGMIMLANEDRSLLVFRSGYGYSDDDLKLLRRTRFHLDNPSSRGIFVVSFREKKPMLVNNIESIESTLTKKSLDFMRRIRTQSFICCPIVGDNECLGILAVDNLASKRPLLQSDMSMLMGISSVIGISIQNARLIEGREQQFQSILKVLASSIDARDYLTAGHSEKVTEYVLGICQEMDLDQEYQGMLKIAALLHDYGKIGVPDSILKKKGNLTQVEYEIIKTHARKTKEILDQIKFEGIYSQVPEIAAAHHERLDGTGYPNNMKGDEIPIGARIIAVADFFEAITSKRHYRNPMTFSEAVHTIRNESGHHLDPDVVEALLRYLSRQLSGIPEYSSIIQN
jgi:HD-GYP domain-containing protein (c-di-GMP phosphodiesterase class II)